MRKIPQLTMHYIMQHPERYQTSLPMMFDDTLTQLQKMNKLTSHLAAMDAKLHDIVIHVETASNIMNENMCEMQQEITEFKKATKEEIERFERMMYEYYMPESVGIILSEWFDSGKLAEIINVEVFEDINDSILKIAVSVEKFKRLPVEVTDSGRIQRAIDWLNSVGGGTLFLEPKQYLVSSTINFKSNIKFFGTGEHEVKVSDDTIGFYSMFEIHSCENVSIENVRYNGNYERTNYDLSNSLLPEAAVRIVNSKNIDVLNNQFTTHGVWTIVAQVSTTYPNNENVRVKHNKIKSRVGKNTNTPDTTGLTVDTTQIYVDGINCEIEGNLIFALDQISPTAIETHRKNTFTQNNIVEGYRNGILIVAGEYAETDNYSFLNINNNIIKNVRQGIVLWQTEARKLDMIKIHDNFILVAANRFTGITTARGISVLNTLQTSTNKEIKNISIKDNTIMFEPFTLSFADSNYTQNFVGVDVRDWVNVENINVENNEIINAPAIGILVGADSNATNTNVAKNVIIKNNTLIDSGYNTNIATTEYNPRCAIRASGGNNKNILNLVIEDNVIIDNSATAKITIPIFTYNVENYVENNNLVFAAGYNLNMQSPYTLKFLADSISGTFTTDEYVRYQKNNGVVELLGNIYFTANNATGYACFIELPVAPTHNMNLPVIVTNVNASTSKTTIDKSYFLECITGRKIAYVKSIQEDNTISSLVCDQLKVSSQISFNLKYFG